TTNGQDAVNALGLADRLNRIRNYLSRDETVFHSLSAHRDTIAHRDRAKDLRHSARFAQRTNGAVGQIVQAYVAGRNSAVTIGHAHDRFFKVCVTETHRAQHGAIGSPLGPGGDQAASLVVAHLVFRGSGRVELTQPTATG